MGDPVPEAVTQGLKGGGPGNGKDRWVTASKATDREKRVRIQGRNQGENITKERSLGTSLGISFIYIIIIVI